MAEVATNVQRAGTPFDWEDLLLQVEDRRVIPLVGADLLQVKTDRGTVPFNRIVAAELAKQLGIAPGELPPDAGLHQRDARVVARRGGAAASRALAGDDSLAAAVSEKAA